VISNVINNVWGWVAWEPMADVALLWHGVDEVPGDLGRTVVTIGVFDGVHRGHRALIGRAVYAAREANLPCVVVTFDPHPAEVVRAGSHPAMLSTLRHRAELLHGIGVDGVLVLHFSHAVSRLTAEEFVATVLVDRLHMARVVVGANFRFGHRALGTVETLRELGPRHEFTVDAIDLVHDSGVVLSSSYIRQCIAEGDVETAAVVLARPHRVEGLVIHGDHRGRELGFPTANLATPIHAAIPADGVYAGWLLRSDRTTRFPAAISVGTNPTFEGAERRVEAYALDRDDLELYGENVAIDFVARLRGQERFESVDALIGQMKSDVARTGELLDAYD
jgi:riboflavin kinase / FMN adenylyltransferase